MRQFVGDLRDTSGEHKRVLWSRVTAIIIFSYLAIHLVLCFTHDINHPDVFLRGDRALQRIDNIHRLLKSENWGEFQTAILNAGLPGDYLWQALIFMISNRIPKPYLMDIVAQIILNTLSLYFLALVVSAVTHDPRITTLTVGLYAMLPNNFVFPHLLVSEAFFVPLGLIAVYYTIKYAHSATENRTLFLSAIFWSLCALTRPYAIIYPLVILGIMLIWKPQKWIRHLILCSIALVPIIIWIMFSLVKTGHSNISSGDPTMFNRNLYSKADYLITTLPEKKRIEALEWLKHKNENKFSTRDLFYVYSKHPINALLINAIETAKFMLKLNETLVLAYLGNWKAEEGWGKKLVEKSIGYFWKRQSTIVLLVIIGSLFWSVLVLLAVVGSWSLMKQKDPGVYLLLAYAILIFGSSLLVDYAQARHRYPADFAICLFAATGFVKFTTRKKRSPLKSGNLS